VDESMYSINTYRYYSAVSHSMKLILGTLVALVVADGLVTNLLIELGLAHEGNPFLQAWAGMDIFLVFKLLGAFLAALILFDIYKHHPRLSFISALTFVVLYTVIVFWNLSILLVNRV